MKFGYFTLTDNSPGYGALRRDPNQFLREVVEECCRSTTPCGWWKSSTCSTC